MGHDIAVLMLTWNRLSFTRQALAALERSARLQPFVLVIFDNASQSPTQDFLMTRRMDMDFEVYFASKNLGVDEPMAWFFKTFDVPYYAKVDNDTVVPENWASSMIQEMNTCDLDVIQARHYTMKQPIQVLMERTLAEQQPLPARSCGGSGIIVRKRFIETFGPPKAHPGKLMDSWTDHLIGAHEQGARYAFSPSVWIELLDMTNHMERAPGTEEYQELIKIIRGGQ